MKPIVKELFWIAIVTAPVAEARPRNVTLPLSESRKPGWIGVPLSRCLTMPVVLSSKWPCMSNCRPIEPPKPPLTSMSTSIARPSRSMRRPPSIAMLPMPSSDAVAISSTEITKSGAVPMRIVKTPSMSISEPTRR